MLLLHSQPSYFLSIGIRDDLHTRNGGDSRNSTLSIMDHLERRSKLETSSIGERELVDIKRPESYSNQPTMSIFHTYQSIILRYS